MPRLPEIFPDPDKVVQQIENSEARVTSTGTPPTTKNEPKELNFIGRHVNWIKHEWNEGGGGTKFGLAVLVFVETVACLAAFVPGWIALGWGLGEFSSSGLQDRNISAWEKSDNGITGKAQGILIVGSQEQKQKSASESEPYLHWDAFKSIVQNLDYSAFIRFGATNKAFHGFANLFNFNRFKGEIIIPGKLTCNAELSANQLTKEQQKAFEIACNLGYDGTDLNKALQYLKNIVNYLVFIKLLPEEYSINKPIHEFSTTENNFIVNKVNKNCISVESIKSTLKSWNINQFTINKHIAAFEQARILGYKGTNFYDALNYLKDLFNELVDKGMLPEEYSMNKGISNLFDNENDFIMKKTEENMNKLLALGDTTEFGAEYKFEPLCLINFMINEPFYYDVKLNKFREFISNNVIAKIIDKEGFVEALNLLNWYCPNMTHAAAWGDLNLVKYLCISGANKAKQYNKGDKWRYATTHPSEIERNVDGFTPLGAAIEYQNKNIVEYLWEKGARKTGKKNSEASDIWMKDWKEKNAPK